MSEYSFPLQLHHFVFHMFNLTFMTSVVFFCLLSFIDVLFPFPFMIPYCATFCFFSCIFSFILFLILSIAFLSFSHFREVGKNLIFKNMLFLNHLKGLNERTSELAYFFKFGQAFPKLFGAQEF